MQLPLQISLHGIRRSNALYESIHQKAKKLDRYHDHIVSCHVALEVAGRHKHLGKQFAVRIDLKVPHGEIAVTHQHDEDLQIALRKAFDAARRKLEDRARTQRGDIKQRSGWPSVRLGRLLG
jgi:ribosomal subunit interface protein